MSLKGIDTGISEKQQVLTEESRPITLSNGETVMVTMSRWHWKVLAWIVNDIRRPLTSVVRSVEECKDDASFDQALQWWLRCYVDWWLDDEGEGDDARTS